ncbi:MAG: RsmB/NOP family class I SAM-dependent RNA methyltransferase, partial [Geminicoccaceae bacterium]
RRMNALDKALSEYLQKTPKSLTLLNILRLGAAQLLILETPPHAALKETVDLARARAPHGSGMVNAVLRRIIGGALEPLRETPSWLFDSWCTSFGEKEALGVEAAHAVEPPLDITCPLDRDMWAERLGGVGLGAQSIRLRNHGAVSDLPGYADGHWWVQDAGAAALVPLLGDLDGRRVLDIGAAPGGKTAQLCSAGAHVTAIESSASRASRLRENAARLSLKAEIIVADALHWQADKPFDVIVLDAPCTATGTIRRHPDILRTRKPADAKRMASQQRQLLEAAIRQLAPGGLLLYAVCSLQHEEGPGQIERLLSGRFDVVPEPIDLSRLCDLPAHVPFDGAIRTSPADLASSGGMDGFFAALLRRTA